MTKPDIPSDVGEHIANREGPEFEARLRSNGISLPPTVTGADILRVVYQEILRDLTDNDYHSLSQGYHFGLSPIGSIIQQLDSELPGRSTDPKFRDSLLSRVREWAATKRGQIG